MAATGGDGTLSYTATPLPAGLIFDDLSRTICRHADRQRNRRQSDLHCYGIADGDSDYFKTFTITVVADLTPTFDPIAGYTARVGSPFSEVLPAATGGDGTLSYTATPLPDGLTFDNVSRTVSGTPTKVEAPTVTYTVRDADGDEAIKTFTISVSVNNTPTLDDLSATTYPVQSRSAVHQEATGGERGRRRLGAYGDESAVTGSLSIRRTQTGDGQADNRGIQDCNLHGARRRPGRGQHDLYDRGQCEQYADVR